MLYKEQYSKTTHMLFPVHSQRQMGLLKFVSSIFPFTLHCPSRFLRSQICPSTFSLPYLIYSFTGLIILRISSWFTSGIKGFVSVLYVLYVLVFKGQLGVRKQVKFFWLLDNRWLSKIVPSHVWGTDYLQLLKGPSSGLSLHINPSHLSILSFSVNIKISLNAVN